jgi:hypothetical protein
MNSISDPLLQISRPDRLHYATGQLLGANDFSDEQTYHRRELALALLYVLSSGTLAGLRVVNQRKPGQNGAPDEVELQVQPGLAIDRAGRLIELPQKACLRLRRWYEFIAAQSPGSGDLDPSRLRAAWRADTRVAPGGVVVADVFLAFHACNRGYTPAFATGPFDALDASQPSRVRDGYELSLVLRPEADANLPVAFDPWASIQGTTPADRLNAAREASLNAWDTLALPPADHVGDWHENPTGVDPTAVLLARLRVPAGAAPDAAHVPVPDWSAAAWPNERANLDNLVRNFLFPPAAIRRLAAPA